MTRAWRRMTFLTEDRSQIARSGGGNRQVLLVRLSEARIKKPQSEAGPASLPFAASFKLSLLLPNFYRCSVDSKTLSEKRPHTIASTFQCQEESLQKYCDETGPQNGEAQQVFIDPF